MCATDRNNCNPQDCHPGTYIICTCSNLELILCCIENEDCYENGAFDNLPVLPIEMEELEEQTVESCLNWERAKYFARVYPEALNGQGRKIFFQSAREILIRTLLQL